MTKKCKSCGSEKLTWAPYFFTTSGVQDGRLRLNDVQCKFVLGCDECSDDVESLSADAVMQSLVVFAKTMSHQSKEIGELTRKNTALAEELDTHAERATIQALVDIIDRELMPHIARLPVQRLDLIKETLIAARKLLEGAQ